MPSDVEQTTHTLNNLRQKREALIARGHSLGEEQGANFIQRPHR